MKLFAPVYEKTLKWAEHPRATWFLGGMSFAESSFFPIPVDVMLAPMALQQRKRWAYLAAIAALFSVLGGVLGYVIGYGFWGWAESWVSELGWMPTYVKAVSWLDQYGFWMVLMAGFTPLPYKVMTIAAGTLNMALLPFVLGSLVGRGARFFVVAGVVAWLGPKVEPKIHQYIEWLGWACVILVVVLYFLLKH